MIVGSKTTNMDNNNTNNKPNTEMMFPQCIGVVVVEVGEEDCYTINVRHHHHHHNHPITLAIGTMVALIHPNIAMTSMS